MTMSEHSGKANSGKCVPLNCVDRCLLALDGIGEHMLLHAILDIEGEIDPSRLEEAIGAGMKAHPVMATVLKSGLFGPRREIRQVSTNGVLTVTDLQGLASEEQERRLFDWMNQPMDLRRVHPLRVLLFRKNERESTLAFTFHHSATDGLRASVFIRRVVESYSNGISEPQDRPGEARTSRRNDELLEFAHSQRSRVEGYYRKMLSSLFRRFVTLALPFPTRLYHDRSGRSRELHLCFARIPQPELARIESRAFAGGVELNDLFLAACHTSVEKWNRLHGRKSNRIRVMAPVNISPKGFRNVVSNQASWISPWTSPEDRADPTHLLKRVRMESIHAARNRLAFSLVYFFYFSSRLPLFVMRGLCRFLMISRTFVDSILITNVGLVWPRPNSEEAAVSRVGEARIAGFTGSAPVVTPMGLSICAGIFDRNLSLTVTYRPSLFSREKAQAFLDLYVNEIKGYPVSVDTPEGAGEEEAPVPAIAS
jgi:NRPS condensation-like uncharacterized protein